MKDHNNIEELFRTSLENLEADVNPALWDKIEAGISANPVNVPSGAASAGKSIVSGWIAGSAALIAVVGITTYFLITNQNTGNKVEATETTAAIKNDAEIKTGLQELPNQSSTTTDKNSVTVYEVAEPAIANTKSLPEKLPFTESTHLSSESKSGSTAKTIETIKNNASTDKTVESSHQNNSTAQNNADHNVNPAAPVTSELQQSQDAAPVETTTENLANATDNQTTGNSLGTLPNIFTPNGDGLNDLFMVKPVDVKSFTVTIFDRSGKVIHSWNNPFGFWDGLLKNGEQAPQGTYFYSIVAENTDGTVTKKQSSITLKR